MKKETIQQLWSNIEPAGNAQFEYILLSKKSIPLLHIGYFNSQNRCLILELPNEYKQQFRQYEKQNISLKYFQHEKCLCIILNEIYFNDLFDELILSIHDKIFNVNLPEEYADLFVRYFLKWGAFFEKQSSATLSPEVLKGLFGELIYLKKLLSNSNSEIDEILNSWRGPYDNVRDFVFDKSEFELKTINQSNNSVKISSEFQLDSDELKNIFLVVISLEINAVNGVHLKDLINKIKIKIYEKFGDISIFLNALAQKGLNFNNLDQYNDSKFVVKEMKTYDATTEIFPKLCRSSIPESIYQVNYKIKLDMISDFIIESISF